MGPDARRDELETSLSVSVPLATVESSAKSVKPLPVLHYTIYSTLQFNEVQRKYIVQEYTVVYCTGCSGLTFQQICQKD